MAKNFIELLLKDYKSIQDTKKQLKEDYTFMARQIIELKRELKLEVERQQSEIHYLRHAIDDLRVQLYNKGK